MKSARIARAGTAALLAGLAAWGTAAALAAPRTPSPTAATQQNQIGEGAVRESIRIVSEADVGRLVSDRGYAQLILTHIERLDLMLPAGDGRVALDNLRLFALVGLERRDEAAAVIDRMLEQRLANPRAYLGPWLAALSFNDHGRALRVVETAAANVPESGREQLRGLFEREQTLYAFRAFAVAEDPASRARLAEALMTIGVGTDEPGYQDMLRRILLDDRLRRGEPARAAELASGISSPDTLAGLIVQRRYDALFPEGTDRMARLRQALDAKDRQTAERLAAAPQDKRRVLERAQFLRTLGRDADALALLEPFTRDVPATAADEDGMWLVNEANYALLALGRDEEAARLMGRLAAMPLADHPYLISASINYGEVLWEVGRYADSLAHARMLERDAMQHASDYGDMWIRATIVCALGSLDRTAEAAPVLAQMRAQADSNRAAMMRAYLCLDDMPAAEALMIARLQDENPEDALMALQDYLPDNPAAGPDVLVARLMTLRERPAVRAAIERIGRVVQLPVARTYWGGV